MGESLPPRSMGSRRGSRRRISSVPALLALALAVLFLLPAASLAADGRSPAAGTAAGCSGITSSEGVTGEVTWNGADICSYGSASSALAFDFTSTANVRFYWNDSTAAVNIDDARLQMFYLGFAVSTRDVIESNSVATETGTPFDMGWNPGVLTYILEGVFGLSASLLLTNGTTVWSENFYVKATAPYYIGALVPIVLILIGVYELYAVARSGRYAAMGAKAPPPPPAAPPPTGAPAPPPTETAAPSEAATPEEPAAAPEEASASPPEDET